MDVKQLQTTVVYITSQTDEVQNIVENNEVHLEELQIQREELEVTIQEMKQLEETGKTSSLAQQNSSDIISIPG